MKSPIFGVESAVVESVETTGMDGHSCFAGFNACNVVLLVVLGLIVYLI